jgi:hypothetical protein
MCSARHDDFHKSALPRFRRQSAAPSDAGRTIRHRSRRCRALRSCVLEAVAADVRRRVWRYFHAPTVPSRIAAERTSASPGVDRRRRPDSRAAAGQGDFRPGSSVSRERGTVLPHCVGNDG